MSLATITEALEALRAGKPVLVVDDEARENEGDAVIAAELATQEWIAWIVRNTSGFLCAPLPGELADRLDLPPMVATNEDPLGTAYTVSVDAKHRLSTGISAADRAHTLRVLAKAETRPEELARPGHILPLRAADGGLDERRGHTEAAVELVRLAGLSPVAAIAEVVADDGEMMRLPELIELGRRESLPVITIEAIVEFLGTGGQERADAMGSAQAAPAPGESLRITFEAETTIPTEFGPLKLRAYRDRTTGADHVAIISGDPASDKALVRVHSECLTGETFGSLKCECGPQLDAALAAITRETGVVVYLRGHEGRGIGLINKLRAYKLQESGLDTLDANLALGLPADARDYGAASAILDDLGIRSVRLLTNNPAKVAQLEDHDVVVTERVPLVVGVGAFNEGYLKAKRDRMGHLLPLLDEAGPAPVGAAVKTQGCQQ